MVTDNRAVAPSDFDRFSITAPVDPRLPDGGGYTVAGCTTSSPSVRPAPTTSSPLSDNYGKQIEHWNGFDFNATRAWRMALMLQGGVSTGRTTTDNCDVVRQIGRTGFGSALSGFTASPSDGPSPLYCHQEPCGSPRSS